MEYDVREEWGLKETLGLIIAMALMFAAVLQTFPTILALIEWAAKGDFAPVWPIINKNFSGMAGALICGVSAGLIARRLYPPWPYQELTPSPVRQLQKRMMTYKRIIQWSFGGIVVSTSTLLIVLYFGSLVLQVSLLLIEAILFMIEVVAIIRWTLVRLEAFDPDTEGMENITGRFF